MLGRFTIPCLCLLAVAAAAQTPAERAQHQPQLDQMREIDRQQARDQHERVEQQRQAAAQAQQQYLAQQAEYQKQATASKQAESEQQPQTRPLPPAAPAPQQSAQPVALPGWSLKNMNSADRIGLAALGVLLIALAFAAGVIPSRYNRNGVSKGSDS